MTFMIQSKYTLGLRAKVSLWSFFAMVWVMVLGGVGLVFTDRVADNSLVIVEDQAVPMIEVGKIKGIVWQIYLHGILHIGLTDPGEMAKQAKEIEIVLAKLDRQIESYGSSSSDSHDDHDFHDDHDASEWLVDFQKAWHVFQEVASKSQALSRDYAKEDAMQLLVLAGEKAFEQVLTILEVQEDQHWQQMTILRQHAHVTRDHASQWIGGVTLLFGLIVLVGWFYARSVSASLGSVTVVLATAIAQMNATINEHERITAQQATSVNETSTTMAELGTSARQVSEQADAAANGTQSAMDLSQQGMTRVEATLRNMENTKERVEAIVRQILLLSGQTGQIRDITDMVSDFANETKMLAMNAAVEAVRAGEHGKGFSVLAVETRKLADESKRSAGQIAALVDKIQKATNATVMAAEEGDKSVEEGMTITRDTAETFQSLGEVVSDASAGAAQISLNVRQQSVAIRQVVEAMQSINTGAKESALGISQIKSGIQTLNESAQTLRKMI